MKFAGFVPEKTAIMTEEEKKVRLEKLMEIYKAGRILEIIPPQGGRTIECPKCSKERKKAETRTGLSKRESKKVKSLSAAVRKYLMAAGGDPNKLTPDQKAKYDHIQTIRKDFVRGVGGEPGVMALHPASSMLPTQMKCSKCDTVFPNKDYPQDNTFMVSSRFGWITHIPRMTNPDMPYQENGAGKGLSGIDSLTSHYWYLKHFELQKSVGALLDAYVRTQDEKYMEPLMALCLGTVDLIEKGTVNRPNRYRRWDCTMLGGIVPGVKMQGPHPLDFSPSYGHWVISIFGPVYDATYDNPMWDKVVPKYGAKARYVFEDKVLSVIMSLRIKCFP
jgi:hypothetical protein